MAYAPKYRIDFLNTDGNNFSIYLLLKDYTGSISQLTGGPDPFVLSYTSGDNQIINPIRASEAEINFYNDGATPLTEFYSEDDEAWRIDFYFNDPAGAKLLWSGFVIQDSCEEIFQDPPHIVSLKGTDNLALLKDIPFNEAWQAEIIDTSNYLTYRQNAITGGDANDGIITLGIDFISSLRPPDDFQTGSSPYKDLVGWGGAPSNDDRWIIKNGSTAKTFHVSGTISVMMTGFSDPVRWLLQKSDDTTTVIAFQNCIVNTRYDLQIDIDITLQPGERLFALQASDGNNNNDKIYYETEWTISDVSSKQNSILDKLSLFDYIKYSLIKTGISLPFATYCNIYENTMGDRQDDPGNDMLRQTFLFSGMFLSDDGTWDDCYSILEKILFALNATLMQAAGKWVVIRWPELRVVSGGLILGSLYDENFEIVTGITLQPNIIFALGTNNILINADHRSRILRPFKNVKFTFNYEQPKGLINWNDLKTLGSFISSSPVTIDGINYRYDNYELPPSWEHTHGDTSFIRVVTNTSVSPETESERYIVTPGAANEQRGIRFNNIDITKDDVMDFSLRFRMLEEDSNTLRFWIRFILVTPNNQYYLLSDPIGGGSVTWTGPFAVSGWDDFLGFYSEVPAGDPKTEYIDWTFSQIAASEVEPLLFPEDGVLAIEVRGTNGTNASNRQETIWNDINFTVTNYINQSTQITGQIHNTSIVPNSKNKLEQEIEIDDSPRNPIAGTLFTAQLTDFAADIGDIHFTKTKTWHRYDLIESLRLGQITTLEREEMQSVSRTILEGSFKSNDPTISILNMIQLEAFPASKFLFGVATFNFMEGIFNTTLWEVLKIEETLPEAHYSFEYIYKTS